MKEILITLMLMFIINSNSQSQDNIKPKVWVGIWDYKLKYQGAYQIDSILFSPSWSNTLHDLKIKAIKGKIKNNAIWHYIFVANDSMEIVKTDSLMQLISITDYEYKWRYEYNGVMAYLQDRKYPPTPEFLPNGHWLYFSTERGKVGVALEKFVKNNQLDIFSKSYDLETGLVNNYFEVQNGLLNGIEYFEISNIKNKIKAINRYKCGVFVENLYDRND